MKRHYPEPGVRAGTKRRKWSSRRSDLLYLHVWREDAICAPIRHLTRELPRNEMQDSVLPGVGNLELIRQQIRAVCITAWMADLWRTHT